MDKIIIKIFLAIFISILQIIFLPYLNIHGIWPNMILIISLYFVFVNDLKTAIILTVVGGIILDLVSPLKFGLNAIFMITIDLTVYYLVHRFFSDINLIIVGLVSVISMALYSLLMILVSGNYFFNLVYIDMAYGFVFGMLLFAILNRSQKSFYMVKAEKR